MAARKRKPDLDPTEVATLPSAADAPPEADTSFPPPDDEAPGDSEADGKKKWENKGFRGRHFIDLGDGRTIHLTRNDSTQQIAIYFSAKEGVDPKPAEDDRQFLKENGFHWRADETDPAFPKKWIRDFLTKKE